MIMSNDVELINKELRRQLDTSREITEEFIQEKINANTLPNRTEEDIRNKFRIGDRVIFVLVRRAAVGARYANEIMSMMYGDLEDFLKGVVHEPCKGEVRENYIPRFRETREKDHE